MDEKMQDRIDKYILGMMSAEDCKTFEKDLANDMELKEQYNYTKAVKETVCEHAQLEELMNQWDKEIAAERWEEEHMVAACMPMLARCANEAIPKREAVAAKPRRRVWLWWVSSIAAVLIVGLFMVNPLMQSEPDFTYESIMKDGVARGGSDLSKIDNLIVSKDYAKALALIEDAEKELDEEAKVAAKLNSSAEGKEQAEYERQEIEQRRDDLTWMKANAFIGLDRKDEAMKLLDNLRKGSGEYKEKAEALYNELTR